MNRLQIHTTDDVVQAIDRMAAKIGISRNAMCAVLLHDAVMGSPSEQAPKGDPERGKAAPEKE